MNDKAVALAARITALEQRLLVAVLQGDDHARLRVRSEIARLKKPAPGLPDRNAFRSFADSAPLVAYTGQP